MDMMKITKELKDLIEKNQNQLKAGIRNHQRLLAVLESDPDNASVQKQLQTEQEHIIVIGLEQKVILDKLRKEYKIFRKQTKINGTKTSIDDKRFNLTVALHHAKKQNISVAHPSLNVPYSSSARPRHHRNQATSPPTPPEDQFDSNHSDTAPVSSNHNAYLASGRSSTHSSPEPLVLYGGTIEEEAEAEGKRPLLPQDIGQVEFLQYLHLATHEVFKEMQSKRVERKRRSTANPQFLYTRGWDISKRKRNFYLSNLTASPPTTRQSVQRGKLAKLVVQQPQVSPPRQGNLLTHGLESRSGSSSPTDVVGAPSSLGGAMGVTLPGITHLPSGLTIEPIRDEHTVCIDCKQPGNLSICEECSHGFHIACHNRPLVSTPRHCPVCYTDAKEARLRQQMAQQSTSPITIVPPATTHQQQQQLLLIEGNKHSFNEQVVEQIEQLEYVQLKGVQEGEFFVDNAGNDVGLMGMTTDGVIRFEQLVGDNGNCGIEMIPVYDI